MKKTIFTAILTSLILFSSSIGKALTGVSVDHGMLVFESKTTYISLVGEFTQEQKSNFINQSLEMSDFASLLESKEANLELYNKINDDFFSAIINGKGYVQIESFIYKVDPYAELVYVFPAIKFELMPSIDAGIITNPEIRSYSMSDDVIGMVAMDIPPSKAKLFCGDTGVSWEHKEGSVHVVNPSGDSGDLNAHVRYFKFGIYYSLKAWATLDCPDRNIEIHLTPIYYKQKCGYTAGPMYQWNYQLTQGTTGGNIANFYAYQGPKPLNFYWFRVVFMAKYLPNYYYPDPSIDLEMKANL